MMIINMPSNKKAQVTLFIIIGLVIAIIIGMTYYMTRTDIVETVEKKLGKAETITEFVDRCLEDTTAGGIDLIGIQGGYIYENDNSLDVRSIGIDSDVGYGYVGGYTNDNTNNDGSNTTNPNDDNRLISIEEMQEELNDYITNALPACLNNLTKFPGQVIIDGDMQTKTTIGPDKVIAELRYPLMHGGQRIDKFNVEVDMRLGYLHLLTEAAVENQKMNPDTVDFTFLDELSRGTFADYDEVDQDLIPLTEEELAQIEEEESLWGISEDEAKAEARAIDGAEAEKDLLARSPELKAVLEKIPTNYVLEGKISIVPVDADNFLLVINDSNLIFLSAFKFEKNNAPEIIITESSFADNEKARLDIKLGVYDTSYTFTVVDAVEFVYQVKFEDEDESVLFTDESSLFDITPDGLIKFTPEIAGEYEAPIIATDSHGKYTKRIIKFIVEENEE
ncbi:MAG: hypothetical protein ABIG89_05315 [Candidatus Woesearchaeota archaeon]